MEGSDVYQKGPPITLPYGNYLGGFATFRPTWTAVRALDAATGHLRWEYRFPPRERSIVMGGLLSTDGDLVFVETIQSSLPSNQVKAKNFGALTRGPKSLRRQSPTWWTVSSKSHS